MIPKSVWGRGSRCTSLSDIHPIHFCGPKCDLSGSKWHGK